MRKRKALCAALGVLLPAAAEAGVVVNFHDASQGTIPGYNQLYFGQGAYSDPGNNVWNGFSAGTYAGGGPGSTLFFGVSNPYPATGGNPGNPYAAYGANGNQSTSGTVLFGTGGTIDCSGNPTSTPAGNATSSGTLSPITLSMNFSSDNGATAGSVLGQPSWLLTSAAITQPPAPSRCTTFPREHTRCIYTAPITMPPAEPRSPSPRVAALQSMEFPRRSILASGRALCWGTTTWSSTASRPTAAATSAAPGAM